MGLTTNGFTRKSLSEILATTAANGRIEFGEGLNTDNDSSYLQLYGPLALELDQLWQESQAIYGAYTQAGAEGIHLDNRYGFLGISRLDSATSTDTLMVGSDKDTPDPTTIGTVRFSNNQGVGYTPILNSNTIGIDNTFAYRILVEDMALNEDYSVSLSDLAGVTTTVVVSTTNEASRLTAINEIRTHILDIRPDLTDLVISDSTGLYVGYSDAATFDIPATAFNLGLTPFAGTRFSRVKVQSEERGLQVGIDRDSYTINPSFTGFVAATGAGAYFAGREVETDAQYRSRVATENSRLSKQSKATDSIKNAVDALTGVLDSIIYENPTDTATSTVPLPYAIQILVVGGTSSEIAKAIDSTLTLNTLTSGAIAVQVPNSSGGENTIRYTAATRIALEFKIDYDTVLDSLLSIDEEVTLRAVITDSINNLELGATLNIFTLQSAIATALGVNRLSALTVNVRRTGDTPYQTTNLVPLFSEILRVEVQGTITFDKV